MPPHIARAVRPAAARISKLLRLTGSGRMRRFCLLSGAFLSGSWYAYRHLTRAPRFTGSMPDTATARPGLQLPHEDRIRRVPHSAGKEDQPETMADAGEARVQVATAIPAAARAAGRAAERPAALALRLRPLRAAADFPGDGRRRQG